MPALNVLTSTKEMDRPAWLAERRKGIGGSDAAAIAGLNPWKTPMEVYLEKIGDFEPEEPNEAMEWGLALENIVAQKFAEKTGLKVVRKNAILQHPEYPFMLGNVDRLIQGQRSGLEVKVTSEYMKEVWEEDKIPDMYLLQCAHYMAVTGYTSWWIAVLIGGRKFLHKEVPRDQEIINHLIEIEYNFWQMVETKTPPAADGSAASTKVINLLYPEAVPAKRIHLPFEAHEWLAAYEQHKAEEKAAKELKDEAANKVKAVLGDAEIGILDNREAVTWKTVNRKGYVVQPTSYRDFRAK